MTTSTRITELSNELTCNIDTVGALGIVRLLRQSDAQLFAGWGAYPGISDLEVLEKISLVASKATVLLKENKEDGAQNSFVFSGCGTSGRIAWLCSNAYNRILQFLGSKPCFHYLISGGDESLITSNELPEDDPPQGACDLQTITREAQKVMFFGITCGLSAPYVAGQIDYAMHQPNYTTVLVGFNPVSLARDTHIEKWHKTCKHTFLELEKLSLSSPEAVILNPIVGPEPITGSSRMKGGSMTEILLDTIFLTAFSRAFGISLKKLLAPTTPLSATPTVEICDGNDFSETQEQACKKTVAEAGEKGSSEVGSNSLVVSESVQFKHYLSGSSATVATIVDAFASIYHAAYRSVIYHPRPAEGIAALTSLAADCLRQLDGHLYYLGASSFGILGLVDSSEMVDTYGAALEEVRGFVVDGWQACSTQEGDLSSKGTLFRISHTHFEKDILPYLTNHDCVICISPLGKNEVLHELMDRVLSTPANCGLLVMSDMQYDNSQVQHSLLDKRYKTRVLIKLPYYTILGVEPVFAGFALKLVLNVVSTGANVLKGRVYGNTMINLTVANDKLYYRAVDIISDLAGVGKEEARTALLRAIYREDTIEKYTPLAVSYHIKTAILQNMVIPLALVLASGRHGTVAEALQVITQTQSLKTLVVPRD